MPSVIVNLGNREERRRGLESLAYVKKLLNGIAVTVALCGLLAGNAQARVFNSDNNPPTYQPEETDPNWDIHQGVDFDADTTYDGTPGNPVWTAEDELTNPRSTHIVLNTNEGDATVNTLTVTNDSEFTFQKMTGLSVAEVRGVLVTKSGGVFYIGDATAGLAAYTFETDLSSKIIFSNNSTQEYGGAIWNNQSLNLSGNFTFNTNSSTKGGGAIYNTLGTVNVNYNPNSPADYNPLDMIFEFVGNTVSDGNGGAIFNRNGTLNFGNGGTFQNNKSVYSAGKGGAIYNDSGTINFHEGQRSTAFESNTAQDGGAIYNTARGTLNLKNVYFTTNGSNTINAITYTTSQGGAIYNAGKMTLSKGGSFTKNKATNGGAIYNGTGTGVVNNIGELIIQGIDGFEFSENAATQNGGAIYNNFGTLNLSNVTFSKNTATQNGGAIYNFNGNLTLNDVNFTENAAGSDYQGGAIYSKSSNTSVNININVSDGKTIEMSNNKVGTNAQSIYFDGLANDTHTQNLNVNVGEGGTLTMADPMSGNDNVVITKTGLGTWDVSDNSSTFSESADVTVSAGTLKFKNSEWNLGDGTFTLNDNAKLSAGKTADTIIADTINLNNGALYFDVNTASFVFNSTEEMTLGENSLYLKDTVANFYANLNDEKLISMSNGSADTNLLTLYEWDSTLGDYKLVTASRRKNGSGTIYGLLDSDGVITLTEIDNNANTNLVWTGKLTDGTMAGAWDMNATANWSGNIGGATVEKFLDNDNVLFAETDGSRNVVLDTARTVGNLDVTVSGYTFDFANVGVTAVGVTAKNQAANASTGFAGSEGYMNFGNAALNANTDGIKNLTLTADSTITLGTGSRIYLDMDGKYARADMSDDQAAVLKLVTDDVVSVESDLYLKNVDKANSFDTNNKYMALIKSTHIDAMSNLGNTNLYMWDDNVNDYVQVSTGRMEKMYSLAKDSDKSSVFLAVINTSANLTGSNALVWQGAAGIPTVWDNDITANWQGTFEGTVIDKINFKNGDNVKFDDTAQSYIVNIAANKPVEVANMTVESSGYTFNMEVGKESPALKATDGIDFGNNGATVNITLSDGQSAIESKNITLGNARLDLTTAGNSDTAVITASGNINLGTSIINISDVGSGNVTSDAGIYRQVIAEVTGNGSITSSASGNGIADQAKNNIRIGGRSIADSIDADPYNFLNVTLNATTNNKITVETKLMWDSVDPDNKAHGNFTLRAGEEFTIGKALNNRTDTENLSTNWNGNSLTKSGTGTLILTATNGYTGPTTIEEGTLQLGNGIADHNGSVIGDIIIYENASLVFNNGSGQIFSNVISNPELANGGSVTKIGSETLTLNGANTYKGATNVNAGTLILDNISTGSYSGGVNVANGATLQLDSGNVIGKIALNGSNAKLDIARDISASSIGSDLVTGTGTTTIERGYTLSGNSGVPVGTALIVASGATLAPGNSIGNIAVNNNVTFENGSTYLVELDPASGTADSLTVSGGIITIESGAMLKIDLIGSYNKSGGDFIVITLANNAAFAAGTDNKFTPTTDDQFFTVTNTWGTQFDHGILADNNYHVWWQSTVPEFAVHIEGVGSQNAVNAAKAVDELVAYAGALPPGSPFTLDDLTANPFYKALMDIKFGDTASLAYAFARVHGEVFAANKEVSAMLQRNFRELLPTGREVVKLSETAKLTNRWGTLTGGLQTRKGINDYSGWDVSYGGFAVGVDKAVMPNVLVGAALGYDFGTVSFDEISSQSEIGAFRTMLYGSWFNGTSFVDFYGGYTKNFYETERNLSAGTFSATAKGKYNGDLGSVGIDVGRSIWQGQTLFTPSIGLHYMHVVDSDTSEYGADIANLYVNGQDYTSLRMPIGLKISQTFSEKSGLVFTPEARIFYVREWLDDSAKVTTSFDSLRAVTFDAESGKWGRDSGRLGLGLNAQFASRLNLRLDYDLEFYRATTANMFSATLGVNF